jgi:alpha-galactosidase
MSWRLVAILGCISFVAYTAHAQKAEGLAETPPMGWNSWNHFGCNIDEQLIRETADALVRTGLRDAGYVYVNMDDCWHGERDRDGFIQPDNKRFPSGIKALADYVHAQGLKLGIYSDSGRRTCAGKPGSQGYEFQDATQYARWGIDYLKYDWCNTGEGAAQRNPVEAYTTMRDALAAAGRPIVFSICEWGDNKPWDWAGEIGHLWRTTGDIINCWNCVVGHGSWVSRGILPILDLQDGLRRYAGPGHWNDPDMMEVGNLEQFSENRAHFAMWAMLAAPLIIGTDLRNLDAAILGVLKNPGVIAVDQDPRGVQGFPILKAGELEIWLKVLADGDFALAFLNRGDEPLTTRFDFDTAEMSDDLIGWRPQFDTTTYRIVDLWTANNIGDSQTPMAVEIGARDVRIYRLVPTR